MALIPFSGSRLLTSSTGHGLNYVIGIHLDIESAMADSDYLDDVAHPYCDATLTDSDHWPAAAH